MKFKKDAIKPDMVIHCPKEEDARVLLEYLESLGYVWCNGANICAAYSRWHEHCDRTGYQILGDRKGKITNGDVDSYLCKITEFSDLIEPEANKVNDLANKANDLDNQQDNEISAVEVLEWLDAAKRHPDAMEEAFGVGTFGSIFDCNTPRKIIEKITAYKAAKKEKPVELEWADTCKIIRIDDNGLKVVVHEEVLTSDRHIMETEAILEKYVKEHEGNYIAVIEDVCRVKGE